MHTRKQADDSLGTDEYARVTIILMLKCMAARCPRLPMRCINFANVPANTYRTDTGKVGWGNASPLRNEADIAGLCIECQEVMLEATAGCILTGSMHKVSIADTRMRSFHRWNTLSWVIVADHPQQMDCCWQVSVKGVAGANLIAQTT